jgi:hypothetical protein
MMLDIAIASAPIVQDICVQATSFSKVEFIYVSRNANCVAHALAKECGPQPSVSLEDRQSCIFTLLIDDVSVF